MLSCIRSNYHFLHLTAGAKADILWWTVFLPVWNGRSFFQYKSSHIRCLRFIWLWCICPGARLVPVGVARKLECGPHCSQRVGANRSRGCIVGHRSCVLFCTDNMAVVEVLRISTAHDPLLLHLRCLIFYASVHHFDFIGEYIAGVHNTAADAISRNNLPLFLFMFPQVPHVTVPQPIRDLLVEIQPSWGSRE